jgi:hypothetical protein
LNKNKKKNQKSKKKYENKNKNKKNKKKYEKNNWNMEKMEKMGHKKNKKNYKENNKKMIKRKTIKRRKGRFHRQASREASKTNLLVLAVVNGLDDNLLATHNAQSDT